MTGAARPGVVPRATPPAAIASAVVAACLLSPGPASAGPFTRGLKAAGKAAKASKGLSAVAKGKAAKAMLVGGVAASETRAASLFRSLPDGSSRSAAYVGRGDGDRLVVVDSHSRKIDASPDELKAGLQSIGGASGRPMDVYVDGAAAVRVQRLPDSPGGKTYVLDADGKPHPVLRGTTPDSADLVDLGDAVMELPQFALDQAANGDPDWVQNHHTVIVSNAFGRCADAYEAVDALQFVDFAAGSPLEVLDEMSGRRFLVIGDANAPHARLQAAAAEYGHDLTSVAVDDPCDPEVVDELARHVRFNSLQAHRAPLLGLGPLEVDVGEAGDPLMARAAVPAEGRPLGLRSIAWTMHLMTTPGDRVYERTPHQPWQERVAFLTGLVLAVIPFWRLYGYISDAVRSVFRQLFDKIKGKVKGKVSA